MTGTDQITLTGISAFGHHGVFDHERRDGQPFVADVTLEVDLEAVVASDELTDTIDYSVLAAQVESEITGPALNTIEALAGRIAGTCLHDPRVLRAVVTVHKPQAPMQVTVQDVAVTVTRSRR